MDNIRKENAVGIVINVIRVEVKPGKDVAPFSQQGELYIELRNDSNLTIKNRENQNS